MRLLLVALAGVVLVVALSVPATADDAAPDPTRPTIALATLDWEPYVGRDLEGLGFTHEIVTAVLERAGFEVQVSFMPWIRVVQEVEQGSFDAAFPAYDSADRAERFWISKPFAEGPVSFMKRRGDAITYRTLEDLAPYRIGVVRGYVNTPEFDAADFLQKEPVNADLSNVKKLARGRIDLAVIDRLTALHLIRTVFPEGAGALDFLEPPLDVKPLHVLFSRAGDDAEATRDAFDAALAEALADGTIAAILARHGMD